MPEIDSNAVIVERVTDRTVVMLKVPRGAAAQVAIQMPLPKPLHVTEDEPHILWFGPDCWLLLSDSLTANYIVERCNRKLDGILHSALDYSASFSVCRISGSGCREVLATGSGVDFRPTSFDTNSCCRTQFARIAVIVIAVGTCTFDLYFDRSYESYMSDWLSDSIELVRLAS